MSLKAAQSSASTAPRVTPRATTYATSRYARGDSGVGSSWRLRSTLDGGGTSMAGLGWVRFWLAVLGPRFCGTPGAGGMRSAGTETLGGGWEAARGGLVSGRAGTAESEV